MFRKNSSKGKIEPTVKGRELSPETPSDESKDLISPAAPLKVVGNPESPSMLDLTPPAADKLEVDRIKKLFLEARGKYTKKDIKANPLVEVALIEELCLKLRSPIIEQALAHLSPLQMLVQADEAEELANEILNAEDGNALKRLIIKQKQVANRAIKSANLMMSAESVVRSRQAYDKAVQCYIQLKQMDINIEQALRKLQENGSTQLWDPVSWFKMAINCNSKSITKASELERNLRRSFQILQPKSADNSNANLKTGDDTQIEINSQTAESIIKRATASMVQARINESKLYADIESNVQQATEILSQLKEGLNQDVLETQLLTPNGKDEGTLKDLIGYVENKLYNLKFIRYDHAFGIANHSFIDKKELSIDLLDYTKARMHDRNSILLSQAIEKLSGQISKIEFSVINGKYKDDQESKADSKLNFLQGMLSELIQLQLKLNQDALAVKTNKKSIHQVDTSDIRIKISKIVGRSYFTYKDKDYTMQEARAKRQHSNSILNFFSKLDMRGSATKRFVDELRSEYKTKPKK